MQTDCRLGMELLSLAAEMHYCSGSLTKAKERVETISSKAIHVQDSFRGNRVLLQCFVSVSDFHSCVKVGIKMLNEMGYPFPKKPGAFAVLRSIVNLKRKVNRIKATDLSNMPKMDNSIMKEVLNVIPNIGNAAFFGGFNNLCVLCMVQGMVIALDHELSVHAPMVISASALLEAHLGNIQKAYDFAKVADDLSQRPDMASQYCRTRAIVCSSTQYLSNRMAKSVDELFQSVDHGFKHSDSMWAFAVVLQAAHFSIFAGKTLHFCEK